MLSQSHIRGLLQSLDFSEGTGTTLNDKSGNGNNATVIGGTWTTDRFGRSNRAILLDGVDDYIDLGLANYQGDLSGIASVKVIAFDNGDKLFNKSWRSNSLYPPSLSMRLGTVATRSISIVHYPDASVVATSPVSIFPLNSFDMYYFAIKHNKAITHGTVGKHSTVENPNISANFTTGYPLLFGTINEIPNTQNPNIAVDRIMLFNRFLSGHELSKLANRLKIGDLDK